MSSSRNSLWVKKMECLIAGKENNGLKSTFLIEPDPGPKLKNK